MKNEPVRALVLVDGRYGANWNIVEGTPSIAREFTAMGWQVDLASVAPIVHPCAWAAGKGLPALEPGLRVGEIGDVSAWDVLVVLPGQAHDALLAEPAALDLVRRAESAGLAIASFCRGSRVLARAGIVAGKHMTGHADYEAEYLEAGAIYHGYKDRKGKSDAPPPIVDGNLVTSMRSNYYRGQICEAIRIAAENARAARRGPGRASEGGAEKGGSGLDQELGAEGPRDLATEADAGLSRGRRAQRAIFAFPLEAGEEAPAFALARSLRAFGGGLAESRLIAMIRGNDIANGSADKATGTPSAALSREAIAALAGLGVEMAPYEAAGSASGLPLAHFPAAAAAAESLSLADAGSGETVLVWLAPDTLILREPLELLLPAGATLAFRPVHHALIGWRADAEPDEYWRMIYAACGARDAFSILSTIDREALAFYPNAGFLSVRPEAGVLRSWEANFAAHGRDCAPLQGPELLMKRRRIFAHQAFLAATILARLPRSAIRELSFGYNYPLHLHGKCPSHLAPKALEDLTAPRYDDWEAFLGQGGAGSEGGLAAGEVLSAWLSETAALGAPLLSRGL